MFKKRRNNKGFTLIELIVVIAILGILAAIAIPRFTGFTERAKIGNDEQYAALIANSTMVMVAAGDLGYTEGEEGVEVSIFVKQNGTVDKIEVNGAYFSTTEYEEELEKMVSKKPLQSKKYASGMKITTNDSGDIKVEEYNFEE